MAVIGDRESVLAFKAVGLEVHAAASPEEAERVLRRLMRAEVSAVFVLENVARRIPEALEEARTQVFPAVIPIPGPDGSTGWGMERLDAMVEKAVGYKF